MFVGSRLNTIACNLVTSGGADNDCKIVLFAPQPRPSSDYYARKRFVLAVDGVDHRWAVPRYF